MFTHVDQMYIFVNKLLLPCHQLAFVDVCQAPISVDLCRHNDHILNFANEKRVSDFFALEARF